MAGTDIATIAIAVENKQAIQNLEQFNDKLDHSGEIAKKTIEAISGALVTGEVGRFVKESIKSYSDLEETTSKFNVVFSSVASDAEKSAKVLQDSYGQSDLSAKKLLSSTGDLLTGFGFTRQEALKLSNQVAQLGSDLASFSNYEGGSEGAAMALTKAMLGETEQAKMLGIAIKTDSPEYKELIKNIKATKDVTDIQAKAFAALQIATEQSKNAIGDFKRTQDSIANQTRIVTNRFEEFKSKIGSEFAGSAQLGLQAINKILKTFNDLDPSARKLIVTFGTFTAGLIAVKSAMAVVNLATTAKMAIETSAKVATDAQTAATEKQTAALALNAAAQQKQLTNLGLIANAEFRAAEMANLQAARIEKSAARNAAIQEANVYATRKDIAAGTMTGFLSGKPTALARTTLEKNPELASTFTSLSAGAIGSAGIASLKGFGESLAINTKEASKAKPAVDSLARAIGLMPQNVPKIGMVSTALSGMSTFAVGGAKSIGLMSLGLLKLTAGAALVTGGVTAVLGVIDAAQAGIRSLAGDGKFLDKTLLIGPLQDWVAGFLPEVVKANEDAEKAEKKTTESLARRREKRDAENEKKRIIDEKQIKYDEKISELSFNNSVKQANDAGKLELIQNRIKELTLKKMDEKDLDKKESIIQELFQLNDQYDSIIDNFKKISETANGLKFDLTLSKSFGKEKVSAIVDQINNLQIEAKNLGAAGKNEEALNKIKEARGLYEQFQELQKNQIGDFISNLKIMQETAQTAISANTSEAARLESRTSIQSDSLQKIANEEAKKTASNTQKMVDKMNEFIEAVKQLGSKTPQTFVLKPVT